MTPKIDTAELSDGQSVQAVHSALREAILRGRLDPGKEVSQVQLARDLGVSRTPLREAIRMLQREGLLQGSPNKRVNVRALSAPDMEQLYTLRISIEVVAIRFTVPKLQDEDIASLEGEMTQMAFFAQREDYERYQTPHRAFHDRLVARSGNRMVGLLSQLSDHCELYRRINTTRVPQVWARAMEQHRQILDACVAGDPDAAAVTLAHHLSNTVFGNVELLDPGYEPAALRELLRVVGAQQPAAPPPQSS